MLEQLILTYTSPSIYGYMIVLFIVFILIYLINYLSFSKISLLFEYMYEKMYDFYADIVGAEEKEWIKTYIVVLFFIILFSNFTGVFLELLAPIFGTTKDGTFILEHYIIIPSANLNFNLAIATISILLILFVQFSSLGVKHFFLDYFPIFGKGYIKIEKGSMKNIYYQPLKVVVKIFDIIISMFLGLLELVGLAAKIISLSFRLFGNMTSGTILLGMLIVGYSAMTTDMFGFNFPVGLPVLIYLQEILVAFIQALVFPLLVAIFIKVARVSEA